MISVVMPAFNESEGIAEFILELVSELKSYEPTFIVIDDCSTDSTYETVSALSLLYPSIEVHRNEKNLGHGPSTYLALKYGLFSKAEIIVAIDGDGQFKGEDIKRAVDEISRSDFDIVEGVRVDRNDPFFRNLISLITRILIYLRSGKFPQDGNTPLRIYRANILNELLQKLPEFFPVPNLYISAYARSQDLRILETHVESIRRRGSSSNGSTWNTKKTKIPSKKFLSFCLAAYRSWISKSF
jgi:glycosyltransferase involved in cell wall biosynthesis